MSFIKPVQIGTCLSIFCLSLFALPSYASLAMAQRCQLGDTCPIPGDDGGITYFLISPANGVNYRCNITSTQNKLHILLHSGKDFKILSGGGYYSANPTVIVDINGRFANPDDPKTEGQIKITKLAGTEGTVQCVAQ